MVKGVVASRINSTYPASLVAQDTNKTRTKRCRNIVRITEGQKALPKSHYILQLNPKNHIIKKLNKQVRKEEDETLSLERDIVNILFMDAQLTSGLPLDKNGLNAYQDQVLNLAAVTLL